MLGFQSVDQRFNDTMSQKRPLLKLYHLFLGYRTDFSVDVR